MKRAHLMVTALVLAGCSDPAPTVAPPTAAPPTVAKQLPALQSVTLYLAGMNKELKIL